MDGAKLVCTSSLAQPAGIYKVCMVMKNLEKKVMEFENRNVQAWRILGKKVLEKL